MSLALASIIKEPISSALLTDYGGRGVSRTALKGCGARLVADDPPVDDDFSKPDLRNRSGNGDAPSKPALYGLEDGGVEKRFRRASRSSWSRRCRCPKHRRQTSFKSIVDAAAGDDPSDRSEAQSASERNTRDVPLSFS
jgi:hypothetical protein